MSDGVKSTPRNVSYPSGSAESSSHAESSSIVSCDSSSSFETSTSYGESAEPRSPVVRQAPLQRSAATEDVLTGWHSLTLESRSFLLKNHIADARLSPQQQAIKLRNFACVSRQSYFDVLQTLNAKGYEAVSLSSTRFAVPNFFYFAEGENNIKQRARIRIAQMVAAQSHSYIDLSHSWKFRPEQSGLRAAVTMGILSANSKKWLRIDLSNYRFTTSRQGLPDPALREVDWGMLLQDNEGASLVAALNKELKRVAKGKDGIPVFDLICHDQPLYTVVYSLVKQLAVLSKNMSGLRSLNLNCLTMKDCITEGRQGEAGTAEKFAKFVNGLAKILTNSPILEFMGLRANGIGPRRVVALARALQHNRVLERLDLSRNPLCTMPNSDRMIIGGMVALKKALAKNTTLLRLNLSFCGIGDAGADELLVALRKNESLDFVDLTGNPISGKHDIFQDKRVVDRARPVHLKTA
jgi:hypothetical protein